MTSIADAREGLAIVAHGSLNTLATIGGVAQILLEDWDDIDAPRRELLLGLIVDGVATQVRDMSALLRAAMSGEPGVGVTGLEPVTSRV